tara:strand:+ start:276 stop:1055 length:780 start_codon:yes stop_codon:yes gene_type:complete
MSKEDNQLKWGEWDSAPVFDPTTIENQPTENQPVKWGTTTEPNIMGGDQEVQQNNKLIWEEGNNDNNEINPQELKSKWEEETDNPSEPEVFDNFGLDSSFSFLGNTNELYFQGYLFDTTLDINKIVEEINNLIEPTNEEGRYSYDPSKDSVLGKLVHNLVKIGIRQNVKIIDSSVIKTQPNESFLNIFKAKPTFNFIYFVQSNEASGDIILDFSSMGGPSYKIEKPKNGQLLVIPGWIPYRISKNKTEKDNILITGMYS